MKRDLGCSITDCESGLVAKWEPCLNIYAEGHKKVPGQEARCVLNGILLCDHCMARLKPEDLISDHAWDQMKIIFFNEGKSQPDRSSVFLTYDKPIDPNKPEQMPKNPNSTAH